MVTSTTTSGTGSYLLFTSPLMRENPDTAEFKSSVGEVEAATAQSGILLYIIWRRNSDIFTVCFDLTIVLICDDVELMGISYYIYQLLVSYKKLLLLKLVYRHDSVIHLSQQ